MKQFAVTYDNTLLILSKEQGKYRIEANFEGANPLAVAQDPMDHNILYCGTFDRGLWKSSDLGASWKPIGTRFKHHDAFAENDIHMTHITTLAAFNLTGGQSILLVGTEPSALFASYDQGESFELISDFNDIPGKAQWFFPPRPHTHHVKWLTSNIKEPQNIYGTIEAGGMVYSTDYGKTWSAPNNTEAPVDIHVLRVHPKYPNQLYGVCGDAFLEGGRSTFVYSEDYGATWSDFNVGIEHKYGFGLAVNSEKDYNFVIATSNSPYNAHHYGEDTFSTLYYVDDSDQWTEVTAGLPEREGTLVSAVSESMGVFYVANNKGIFYSEDGGQQWSSLNISWPEELTQQHAHQIIWLDY